MSDTTEHAPVRAHRYFVSGVAIVIGFFGLINLASIVAQHGFEWHAVFKAEIDEYRRTIYPIYDFVLRPVLSVFHLQLSQTAHDILTASLLLFCAANTETILRDGKPLWIQLFKLSAAAFSGDRKSKLSDEEQAYLQATSVRTFLTKGTRIPKVYGSLFLWASGVAIVLPFALLYLEFSEMKGLLETQPVWHWLLSWLAHWKVLVAAVTLCWLCVLHEKYQTEAGTNVEMVVLLLRIIFGVIALVAGWPIIALFLAAACLYVLLVALLAFLFMFLFLTFFAPFVAWRTCVTTAVAFALLMIINSAMLHGIL